MEEEYDTEIILFIIVVIAVIIGVILAGWYFIHLYNESKANKEFKVTCENNPRERYGQPCDTLKNCIEQCTFRLRNTTS